jgi:aspartate aminotransferase-like enzyme
VDAVTAAGALELRCERWGIDVCVTGSQKGLMLPPGLAFVALSERAVAAAKAARMPRFYLDLRRALEAEPRGDTPWTPAVGLVLGLEAALSMIRREGIEAVWHRHALVGAGVRAGVRALGLELFSRSPSNAVTAVRMPEGVTWDGLRRALDVEAGVTVAGGQGEFAGRLFRIGHLGYVDQSDVLTVIAALERALQSLGRTIRAGSGVSGALEAMKGLSEVQTTTVGEAHERSDQ